MSRPILANPVHITAGTAIGSVSFLSPDQHSLTAVFIPTKFQPSTSNTITF
ncbi:MAG TPA: hypothetical protein VFN75_10890 [Pseudonocardiaceae bacterium]|nr:hypothetical protein [Pseudonocardiaceae bacterium]